MPQMEPMGTHRFRYHMTTTMAVVLLTLAATTATRATSRVDEPAPVAWGVTVGVPQTLGLTVEANRNSPFRFQASIGTVIMYSSVTTRLILIQQNHRFLPYGFVGVGVFHKMSTDTDPGDETQGFGWAGGGLRLRVAPVSLFAELGFLGGSYDQGITAAAGLLFAR